MIIEDRVYGKEEINEQVLIDLISSVPVQRLKEISQFGMPDEYYHIPSFSRFEHSIGVMILLRRLNAGLEEQIAGLLHDVSHTAFSHVMDWVVGDPIKETYQDETLLKTFEETEIKNILEMHDFNCKKIAEIENYSLLEQSIPHLCADRVDYSLREIKFLHSEQDIEKILKDLRNVNGKIVLASAEAAKRLAENYNKLNKEHWAEDQTKARYYILANILKKAMKEKIISIENMMKTDKEIIKSLKKSDHEEILAGLNLLKNGFYLKKTGKEGLVLPKKFRYLDPKFFHNEKIISLSEFSEEYKKTVEEERKQSLINEGFSIIPIKMNIQQYFETIESETKKIYEVAEEARSKGFDPASKVEITLARSLAEKVVGLISTVYPQIEDSGIVERILELEKEHGKLDPMVSFKIAEEVAKQKFCKFPSLIEAIEAGIRVGFAYITLGVVSSPIEGFTGLELGKTKDEKDYFIAYFSGPIRSAGTTASCLALILIDYLRGIFGYAKYDPTPNEIKRYVTENQDYHDRITNLQYMPTKEELAFLAENIPIQIDGDPTTRFEVSNHKNLKRVKTNYVRGGMCLIFSEGLAQKAAKGLRLLNKMKEKGLNSNGFDFLEEYIKLHEKRDTGKADESPTYIQDLVAGRPIFGHPSESGAFRFRYGRGRSSGFSATSIHPATMEITDGFIAIGTQLKTEKPIKGCIVTSCDSLDGPIVKLFSGSVKKIKTREEAKRIYKDVEEIIYLGDILFSFSDVTNRNFQLIKPGYVEEIWKLELREKNPSLEKNIGCFNVDFEDAIKISRKNDMPLHPEYIFYWTQISKEQFKGLISWLKHAKIDKKIILPYKKTEHEKFKSGKRALEILGIEHDVVIENIIISFKNSKALFANLGIDPGLLNKEKSLKEEISQLELKIKESEEESILSLVNSISEFEIKDKAGDFIGARMGRPEKAKLRKLTGSPNVLFPVGREGGRLRSVQAACEVGSVVGDFPIYYCENCKHETIFSICEDCEKQCKKMFYCFECEETSFKVCEEHQNSKPYYNRSINISRYMEKAKEKLRLSNGEVPLLIKGVRGTSSKNHRIEPLTKGILRAMFDLQVNKDGTIRFDATEMPLVSFKPKEISVSVEKLKEIGYTKDIFGKELVKDDQILDLKPHDILLPSSPDSPERADKVFMDICHFVDELLIRFYGMKPLYNIKKREDLVGKLGVCMAPHNCAGVICRIIGFSNTLGLFASPFMHAAIRRDCDGDEAAIMLLGDVLLNFSKEFLPSHRGGTQDAPLVLNARINAGEVDEQILDFELVNEYPLELYRKAEQRKHSSKVKVYDVRTALKEGKEPFANLRHTHNTLNINEGVGSSNYKRLATMQEKVKHQMELVEKIRAANTSETARLIIERHFIKDMRGNLRKFSTQEFRCVKCNEKMRRPPLSGGCSRCSGKIIFTTHEGGVKKYLEPALELAKRYNLSPYIKQTLELTKRHIDSVFGKEPETQETIEKWF